MENIVSEHSPSHMEPFLLGEQPALDCLNSVCAPWGETLECFADGAGYVSWLQKAGLIALQDVRQVEATFSPAQLHDISRQAQMMREQFRAIISQYAGQSSAAAIPQTELGFINDILQQEARYAHIEMDEQGAGLRISQQRRWRQPTDLLQPLAYAMAQCLCESDLARIKKCENPECTLWFLDVSKNGRRRWCSMAICGNRAKAAAYRKRKQ